jgi:hypothetical protein
VTHMKTTIEIADPLMLEVKRFASERHRTVRSVMEDALRRYIEEELQPRRPFKLRDASVGGSGLRPEFAGAGWDKIRDAIYEGHGA